MTEPDFVDPVDNPDLPHIEAAGEPDPVPPDDRLAEEPADVEVEG